MSDGEKTHKLMEQTDKGQKSETLLHTLKDAFEVLDEQCYEKFRESSVHDHEGHMACALYMKVLDDVKDRFELAVVDGKAARKELIHLATTQSPKL